MDMSSSYFQILKKILKLFFMLLIQLQLILSILKLFSGLKDKNCISLVLICILLVLIK